MIEIESHLETTKNFTRVLPVIESSKGESVVLEDG